VRGIPADEDDCICAIKAAFHDVVDACNFNGDFDYFATSQYTSMLHSFPEQIAERLEAKPS